MQSRHKCDTNTDTHTNILQIQCGMSGRRYPGRSWLGVGTSETTKSADAAAATTKTSRPKACRHANCLSAPCFTTTNDRVHAAARSWEPNPRYL
jgi:hypothetical protein